MARSQDRFVSSLAPCHWQKQLLLKAPLVASLPLSPAACAPREEMSPRHALSTSRMMALPAGVLLLSLLLLSGTTPCAATFGDDPIDEAVGGWVDSPDVEQVHSTALESWISYTLQEFEQRTEDVANGISAPMDAGLQRAERQPWIITVRQDGKGDFQTITEAIGSIPKGNARRTIIKIGPGVYREKLKIEKTKPYVTFYGDPVSMPTITFDGTAAVYGTWDSATVAVESHFFMACNIVFENSAPMPKMGASGTQAVALRISGDKAAFYNCKFYGFQDTLCDDKGKHYFKDCLIRGTVDFIFGNGRSIYMDCEIQSVAPSTGVTALVAQGRDKVASKGGFSFIHCKITGSGSAYLSRAWRESSRVVFAYTYMGSLIHPKGWDDKGHHERDRSVFYGEYKCMGPGSATTDRVSYGRVLTDRQVRPFLSKTFIRASTWLLPPPKL